MNLKNAFTGNRVATHYGLADGDKWSASGTLGLLYQTVAVHFAAFALLFTGTAAIAATAGLPLKALLCVACVLGFVVGGKLLIGLCDAGCKRLVAAIPYNWLRGVATLILMLVSLAVVMAWPAAFLFLLAKAAPSVVSFIGWNSALMAGFGVLCADGILGGLTGVSLLSGKRAKIN